MSGLAAITGDVGATTQVSAMRSFTTLTPADGVYYAKALNTLVITKSGVNFSDIDFSGVSINVQVNDVTFKNCNFDASAGTYAINGLPGTSNLTIDHCNFDGLKLDKFYNDFITSRGLNTVVTNSVFVNAPSDAISIQSGTISGNYIGGGGYVTGAHADGVWIGKTIGPVMISDNVIDWRSSPDAATGTNNAVRITGEAGDVSDVTVKGNIILGGSYSVLVTDGATMTHTASQVGTVTNVDVVNNVVDYGQFGNLYQLNKPADLLYSGNHNASGTPMHPDASVIGTLPDMAGMKTITAIGLTDRVAGTAGADYLVGSAGTNLIEGGAGNDVIIGGGGRDYTSGGAGKDIFVFNSVADGMDWISDFTKGEDKIYLAHFTGAPKELSGWSWTGSEQFTGAAWQLRYTFQAGTTLLQLDINGDMNADFSVQLNGTQPISLSDLILLDSKDFAPLNQAPTLSGAASAAFVQQKNAGLIGSGVLIATDADHDAVAFKVGAQSAVLKNGMGVDNTCYLTAAQLDALKAGFSLSSTTTGDGGSTVWTYSASAATLASLGSNETLTLTTKVIADDLHGGLATKDIVITIAGQNDGPVINPGAIASATLAETAGLTASNLVRSVQGGFQFTDADVSDRHVVSVAAVGRGYIGALNASVAQDSTGAKIGEVVWTFSAPDRALDLLAAGQQQTQLYTVALNDGKGGLIKQDISIVLVGANDAPTVTGSSSAAWYEGGASTYLKTGVLTFADADLTDQLTTSLVGQDVVLKSAAGVNLSGLLSQAQIDTIKQGFSIQTGDIGSNKGTAAWSYFATDKTLDFLGQNDSVTLTSKVLVDDHNGGQTTKDVVITMKGINDNPLFDVQTAANVAGDVYRGSTTDLVPGQTSLHQETGAVSFFDADLSDKHTVTVRAAQTGYLGTLKASVFDAPNGHDAVNWTFQVDDAALSKLTVDKVQTYTLMINDGHGGAAKQDISVTLHHDMDPAALNAQLTTQLSHMLLV